MNLSDLPRQIMRFVGNNSPAILTGVGAVGVITTAVLTAKATFKAFDAIHVQEVLQFKDKLEQHGDNWTPHDMMLSSKERFDLVWKLYIPPAVACFATVTAIICSNRIEYRRAAAVAAAYAISEKGWMEYRDKIVEKLGPKKEQAARDERAQDLVTQNPPSNQIIITGDGDVLCYDQWSGRYFWSTMEKIKTAQVEIMCKVLNRDFASLSEFYDELGLAHITESDDIGWNSDVKLELDFSHAFDDRNRPCLTFAFRTTPFRW